MAGRGMAGAPKLFTLLLLSLLLAVAASPSLAATPDCKRCYYTHRRCYQSCIGGPDEHKCKGFCDNDYRDCKEDHHC